MEDIKNNWLSSSNKKLFSLKVYKNMIRKTKNGSTEITSNKYRENVKQKSKYATQQAKVKCSRS